MRVCLANVCVERTHEKKLDSYFKWGEKTHSAEKIASIRGKKTARILAIFSALCVFNF